MITTQNKWKDRTQLPVYKKLTQFQFDPVLLLKSYNEIKDKDWNAMSNEYSKFTESHNIVTKKFSNEYQQYGLTEFDSNYNIENRTEKSGSIWDRKIAKSNVYADERFYRKRKNDISKYIEEVLDTIGKDVVHKTRFAKLPAGKTIKKHIDHDTKYGIRLHIPIITNEKSVYGGTGSDGVTHETHFPADGGVWFINPGVPHWVHNRGDTERVHLIISCDTQEILYAN
jgi:tellurite resistance-related uncharacterized protein